MALLACAVALVPAPAASEQAGLTTFVAKRAGLKIRLEIRRQQIRLTEMGASLVCEGNGTAAGDDGIRLWGTFGFGIKRSGHFQKQEYEHFGAAAEYFWRLEGVVRGNRIVGTYTAREERFRDGEALPPCGTRSPLGLPLRFVAHRVSGPRWHI